MTLHLHNHYVDGCYRCEIGNDEADWSRKELIQEAREFVKSWRDDDEQLRIPSNEFGEDLAYYIDILLEVTEEK
jgi:hypothetical protein